MKINLTKDVNLIDWTKQQLLIAHDNQLVVLTTGIFNETCFEAISIEIQPSFSDSWKKSAFKIFQGTITND
jgi:hypothetical protein